MIPTHKTRSIGGVETGARGERGESAYEVWLKNGNKGTIEDFLNSLRGRDGRPGRPGAKGEPGEKGEKGDPGSIDNVRFFISEDGHLHVEKLV